MSGKWTDSEMREILLVAVEYRVLRQMSGKSETLLKNDFAAHSSKEKGEGGRC